MEGIVLKIFFNGLVPLFALGVVVFVHELGHFLVAKWCGIKVLKFSIGFGPKIFSWKKGDTEYRISWFFFGGYVKFLGDEVGEEGAQNIEGAYYATKPLLRTLVCLAGPAMNLLFGFAVYCFIFMIGRPTPVDERSTVIGSIVKDSPAEVAGLQVEDKIISVDGHSVTNWKDVVNGIALSNQEKIKLDVMRGEEVVKFDIAPTMDAKRGLRVVGIAPMETLRLGAMIKASAGERAALEEGDRVLSFNRQKIYQWHSLRQMIEDNGGKPAMIGISRNGQELEISVNPEWDPKKEKFVMGFTKGIEFVTEHPNPFQEVVNDVRVIFDTLAAIIAGTVSPKGLAGPVGILILMSAFAKAGLVYFLGLIALISINLGVFNLLPIPILDGGHVMFNIIEFVRRKALPKKTMILIQNVFVAILFFLLFFVTYQDLSRFGSNMFSKSSEAQQEEYYL